MMHWAELLIIAAAPPPREVTVPPVTCNCRSARSVKALPATPNKQTSLCISGKFKKQMFNFESGRLKSRGCSRDPSDLREGLAA